MPVRAGAPRGPPPPPAAARGPAPPDRERVFERFVRLDEARSRDEGGAGLGLAIAREVLQRHGGTLALTDASCGAAFEIRLPRAR